MNADKTIQQMEAAIFAYCDEVCPKFQDSYAIEGIVTLYREHGGIRVYNFDTNTMIFTSGKINREGSIRYHYRLLGLAERDAVAEMAEKVAILENEVDFLKTIRESQASMIGKLHPETLDLQARNTALVAQLTECLDTDYCNFHEAMSLIEEAKDILKSANTEKGGVQG